MGVGKKSETSGKANAPRRRNRQHEFHFTNDEEEISHTPAAIIAIDTDTVPGVCVYILE